MAGYFTALARPGKPKAPGQERRDIPSPPDDRPEAPQPPQDEDAITDEQRRRERAAAMVRALRGF